jgi:hypothetical protein
MNSHEAEIRHTVEILRKQLNDSFDIRVQRDRKMQDLERLILAAL